MSRALDSAGFRNGAWRKSLNDTFAIVAICAAAAWLWTVGSGSRPLEATIQLERFAASIEHTGSVDPGTARDLGRMLALPGYDCARVACSAAVQVRNSAVRARLVTLMAMKRRSDTITVWRADVSAANPVQAIDAR